MVQDNSTLLDGAPPPAKPRWFDRYSAAKLPAGTRAQIVDMLAQPRQYIPYSRIATDLSVCEGIVKSIEDQERESIAIRKEKLMAKAFRIADKAADRVEETIHEAGVSQAAVVHGIFTEKALLLAGEPTQRIEVTINAQDIYSELRTIQAEIVQSLASTCTVPDPVDAEFLQLPQA